MERVFLKRRSQTVESFLLRKNENTVPVEDADGIITASELLYHLRMLSTGFDGRLTWSREDEDRLANGILKYEGAGEKELVRLIHDDMRYGFYDVIPIDKLRQKYIVYCVNLLV